VTTPGSEEQAIAAAIIARGGSVLLVKRRASEGKLSWQFPAGAIEEGESPEDAAVREAREETASPSRWPSI
jgi:8-oxo-dGTP diphosphatase